MTKAYSAHTQVTWPLTWPLGQGQGIGKVVQHAIKTIRRKIQGKYIVRKGTEENPAYVIEQEDGGKVLKLHSELSQAKK